MGRRNNYVEKLFALNIINSQTDHKPDICFKCNGVAWYCLRLTTLTAVPIYLDFLTRTSWYCVWSPGVYLSDTATLPNDTKTALLYLKNLFPLEKIEGRLPRIMTKQQLYSIIRNWTMVDTELVSTSQVMITLSDVICTVLQMKTWYSFHIWLVWFIRQCLYLAERKLVDILSDFNEFVDTVWNKK